MEKTNKEELEKALNEIKDSYDAYFFLNKYGAAKTHEKQFALLQTLKGDKVEQAIGWIKYEYDCYYANDFEDETGTAFEYLRNLIKEQ